MNYIVDGRVGVTGGYKKRVSFGFHTGESLNSILRNAVLYCWEKKVGKGAIPPMISDASGNPLELGEVVRLSSRFENTVFQVQFMVAERLSVHDIIINAFINRQSVSIRFQNQKIEFPQGLVPTFGHGSNTKSERANRSLDYLAPSGAKEEPIRLTNGRKTSFLQKEPPKERVGHRKYPVVAGRARYTHVSDEGKYGNKRSFFGLYQALRRHSPEV